MRFSLVTVVFLCACQSGPDVELERARANFTDFTLGAFSPKGCNRTTLNVRRRPDKSIEGSVTWQSAEPPPLPMTAVFVASPSGWKCDQTQSSSAGACEFLESCRLLRDVEVGP